MEILGKETGKLFEFKLSEYHTTPKDFLLHIRTSAVLIITKESQIICATVFITTHKRSLIVTLNLYASELDRVINDGNINTQNKELNNCPPPVISDSSKLTYRARSTISRTQFYIPIRH